MLIYNKGFITGNTTKKLMLLYKKDSFTQNTIFIYKKGFFHTKRSC